MYFCFMSFTLFDTQSTPLQDVETDVLTTEQFPYNLIVWNDDVNTFDWVIETLMEVCGHSEEQAEQCSIIYIIKANVQ